MKKMTGLLMLTYLATNGCAVLADGSDRRIDFGMQVEKKLNRFSDRLFGIKKPLAAPATEQDYVSRDRASAGQRLLMAKGLKATFVARNVAHKGDMISFWPSANSYSHLIVCIEQSRETNGLNASLQRINVKTGKVETILYGMNRCDGIRTTPWGTILATEEAGDGRAYEVINPLATTANWVANRDTGDIRSAVNSNVVSKNIVQRTSLPTMSWEGLAVLPTGVVIGGDELRPGSYADATGIADTDGGSIFKFIPAIPKTSTGNITELSQSPLVSGNVFAMQVSCRENKQQTGQGCEVGNASWVSVNPLNARVDANNAQATGYYRPEDMHLDPGYTGNGVRFCWTNTGRSNAAHYGEVLCGVDSSPLIADNTVRSVVVNRVFEGDPRFNSVDNLAFQPGTGNMYVIEDHSYGEIFACLPDGGDRDIKTDGCVGVLSVVDPLAEPSGFTFDASGKVAFVMIQHGEQPDSLLDFKSNPVDGRTDDLIMIRGFKSARKHKSDK